MPPYTVFQNDCLFYRYFSSACMRNRRDFCTQIYKGFLTPDIIVPLIVSVNFILICNMKLSSFLLHYLVCLFYFIFVLYLHDK